MHSPDDSLYQAVLNDGPDLAAEAIGGGASIDRLVSGDQSLLLLAIQLHSYAAAEVLIGHGADVNLADAYGCMPLHLATLQRRRSLITLLMKRGADRHARDTNGKTPHDVAPSGFTLDWDQLSDPAMRALKARKVSALAPLLLCDGRPTQALLELCGTHRLAELLPIKLWVGHEHEALDLIAAIERSLPHYWRAKSLIDPSPIRRAGRNVDLPLSAVGRWLKAAGGWTPVENADQAGK